MATDDQKKNEALVLSAGYRGAIRLVLVPRTEIALEAPTGAAATAFRDPKALQLELPIKGTCKHFPAGELPCSLTLLIKRGEALTSRAFGGTAVMKVQGDRFHVEVNGRTPVIDLAGHGLVGRGSFGLSLTPDFPHAATAILAADAIPFDVPFALKVDLPDGIRLGTPVTFTPQHHRVFDKAELELRVVELDGGAPGEPPAFVHRWAPGAARRGRRWAVGFLDENGRGFCDVGQEASAHEYGWQLWVRGRPDGPAALVLDKSPFATVPKARLEVFRLEYDPSWEGTWEVHGKIAGLAPGLRLAARVALVDPAAPGEDPLRASTRLEIAGDGTFEGHLGPPRFFAPSAPSPAATPPRAYAILSLPAADRDGKPGPLGSFLEWDEAKLSGWAAHALTWDLDAAWVASEEAVTQLPRPPQPRRRAAGLTTSPAPPPEAGGATGPLSLDDIYKDICAWEGVVAFMYRDTHGYVTVGAGNKADPVGDAVPLPFQNKDAGRKATEQEIKDAWKAVKAMPAGLAAPRYALRPSIELPDDEIKKLALARLDKEFLSALRRDFPGFDQLPRPARRALVDMAYNLGVGAFPSKWPTLKNAVVAKDWARAAESCRVKNGRPERNEWRAALFLYAATAGR
jgi:GH24 family phage-related lysozyme (muramidase)